MQHQTGLYISYITLGLLTLLGSAIADPCLPFGPSILYGRNCPASTYPSVLGSEGTRIGASATIAYCASADNWLYTETRFNLDGSTIAQAGNILEYSIWWDQPDTHCVLDIVTGASPYTYLRDQNSLDANGLPNHPRMDLSAYAFRKWYTRRFVLPASLTDLGAIGLTVTCETPDTSVGNKHIFLRGVKLLDAGLNLIKQLADEGVCGATCSPACQSSTAVCSVNLQCSCSAGWQGTTCATPICRAGCTNGGCTQPDQCDCTTGWQGSLCDTAICYAGCMNGGCTQPDQCNCYGGWQGSLCDTPICRAGCVNGGCTQPDQCDCMTGWQGSLCDAAICAPGCANGTCALPGQCNCNSGWQGALCTKPICAPDCATSCVSPGGCTAAVCQGTPPVESAVCGVIDGIAQWIYNGTLYVNGSVTVDSNVLVVGDLIVGTEGDMQLQDGAVVIVTGCPSISGSLSLILTAEELAELESTGQLNRTVLLYSALCSDADFPLVTVDAELACTIVEHSQQKSPGVLVLLITARKTECNLVTPSDAEEAPLEPWAIAIIVVGSALLLGGVAMTVGLVMRKQQQDRELAKLKN